MIFFRVYLFHDDKKHLSKMILIPDYYFKSSQATKKLDENGNPQANTPSSGGSVSFSARQLKPLSIYRHNPAFHSQHVSVNQMDEIPSLSPTSLQPPSQIPSTSCNEKCGEDSKKMSSKLSRRKKKVLYWFLELERSIFLTFLWQHYIIHGTYVRTIFIIL